MRYRLRGVFAVATMCALVAAGCGSSSKSSTATTTTAASSNTTAGGSGGGGGTVRGVTDKEIVIGGVAEAKNYQGIDDGAKARFDRVNRSGGINGRMIKYLPVADDGSDNSRNLDAVRQLVTRDKVFALAPVASQSFLPASSDYLAAQKVPFVGWGFMPGFCGNDFGYGFNGCLIGNTEIQGSYLAPMIKISGKAAKDVKFAFQSEDGDAGKTALRDFGDICKKEGCQVVYTKSNIPLNTTVTDYTPYVQAIMASNPDVAYVNVSFANALGLTGALKAAGFKGLMVNFVTYAPGLLETQPAVAKILEGTYINVQIPPAEAGDAASKQVIADLTASGAKPFVSFGASVGYWSADVLVQMLEKAGKDLTPDTFQAAINGGGGFTYKPVAGGLGPVAFPADHTAPNSCTSLVTVKNGKYAVALPMTCYPNYKR
ncbi:MAG: hypothetical protein JWN46_3175 [Acidimicrobiales bacterium]|nr:hypothetical protein [Acidimicrobiales bacterium]